MTDMTTEDAITAGGLNVARYIRRELGWGNVVLTDKLGKTVAVLPFVPGVDAERERWIMAQPALETATPVGARVEDTFGRKWFDEVVGNDLRLTQEHAVKGEMINVCEWRLRRTGDLVFEGRGVKYDGYRLEG